MESTAANVSDLITSVVKGFKNVSSLVSKDLAALPEEAFTKKFGDKVRTVADIIYEVNIVNDHFRMVIAGETPFDFPEGGWITAPNDLQSKAVVEKAFAESAGKFLATIEGYSASELAETLQTDEGATTRHERIRFATLHMWYHLGQLNFVQTLYGDDAWHWASE